MAIFARRDDLLLRILPHLPRFTWSAFVGLGRTSAVLSWVPFRLIVKDNYAIYVFHLLFQTSIHRLLFVANVGEMSAACFLFVQTAYYAMRSALLLGIAIVFHSGI